jgi:DNA invertase Pin-like site-specific DNA recombinase
MKKATTRTPAVAYLRVSGKAQAGADRDGFPRQRDAIQKFAQRHGYEVIDEFRDEGVSGTRELENRPALAALIDRIASNGVRVVIVERADRLARDLMIGEVILREFAKHSATVLTADGQDLTAGSDDPTRKLIRQVLGAVSEFEKSVLVLKLRAARQRKRARGERVEGVKPFGFFPGEAAIIERMRTLRRKPKKGDARSFAEIAATLNADGIPTRNGGQWAAQTVGKILRRERGK